MKKQTMMMPFLMVLVLILIGSCSSEDHKKISNDNTVAVPTAKEVFIRIDTALATLKSSTNILSLTRQNALRQNAGDVSLGNYPVGNSGNTTGDTSDSTSPNKGTASKEDPLCTAYGEAIDSSTSILLEATAGSYVPRTFHCLLTYNSGDTATFRGTYALVQGLICAIEAQSELEYSASGVGQTLTIQLDDQCFSAGTLSTMPLRKLEITLTSSLLANESGWTHLINLNNSLIGQIYIKLLRTASQYGFMISDFGNSKELSSVIQAIVNLKTQTLLFDAASVRTDGHFRLMTKGSIETKTFTFSDINAMQAIALSGAIDSGALRVTSEYLTIKGDSSRGYKGYVYGRDRSSNVGKIKQLATSCTPSSSTCDNQPGLPMTEKEAVTFLNWKVEDQLKPELLTYANDGMPLSFTEVTPTLIPETANPL